MSTRRGILPVCPLAVGLKLGAAELGLREGGGGEGEGLRRPW